MSNGNFSKEELEAMAEMAYRMCSAPVKEYLLIALNEAEEFFKAAKSEELRITPEELSDKISAASAAKSHLGSMQVADFTGRREFNFKEHKYKLVMHLAVIPLDFELEIRIQPKYNIQVFKNMDGIANLARAFYGMLLQREPALKENLLKVFGPAANSLSINENNRSMYFVLQQKMRLGINAYYADTNGKIVDTITDEMLSN